ncbi:hypothetical protein Bca52824_027664 [Brassica carinata]|uniref:Casein kinase II subunit beta n=1 Tax=Brassica carinata TaxID=52824 RepID=A0A8X7VAW1_BRACI|nr:hypothetical protein Bca52824_027664 [Brassica carinata]
MYKESGLKSEVVDRKRLYELYDNGACHPTFQTVSGASNSVKQLHDHSNRDSRSDDGKESGISGSDVKDTSWISWFCNLRGNELFCQIDDYYIQDHFNLCGLIHQVPYYDYALDLILDVDFTHGERFTEKQYELVESALDKYKNHDFGRCPRVFCGGQPSSTIKIYCPKCEDVYYPRSKYQANIDGAYFGTTFPHLFLMTYGDMKPQKASQSYVPKVFGFKLHKP